MRDLCSEESDPDETDQCQDPAEPEPDESESGGSDPNGPDSDETGEDPNQDEPDPDEPDSDELDVLDSTILKLWFSLVQGVVVEGKYVNSVLSSYLIFWKEEWIETSSRRLFQLKTNMIISPYEENYQNI